MFGICVKPVLYLWNKNKQIKNQRYDKATINRKSN